MAAHIGQQLLCLGYNVASSYDLIGLLVLRGDYSMGELFKHITLFSPCSSEAWKQLQLNLRCCSLTSKSWSGAAQCAKPKPNPDQDTKVTRPYVWRDDVKYYSKKSDIK